MCANTPSVTDWIMVGITAVYVIATILILRANKKTAKAAEEQLAQSKTQLIEAKNQFEQELEESKAQIVESKRQFEESRRLACFPFLQFEKVDLVSQSLNIILPNSFRDSISLLLSESKDVLFKMKNVGNGTAINLMYAWETELEKKHDYSLPDINAIMNKDAYDIRITVPVDYSATGYLVWGFDDLLGNHYIQKIFIAFQNGQLYQFDNDMPMYKHKSF